MIPKFRAWDPDTKFMNDQVRVTSNRFGDGEVLVEGTDGFGWIEVKPEYLMQSTGLKDKNGMEIFEGDIVVIKYSEQGYHYYEKIVFENGTFTAGDEDWLYNIKDYCVVCGNIYENPKLLEPANEI
ncbi:YopX family protein [Enterococcus casseliflavus]|nr:YopX family protein [Enterococcus casseliflavus]